MYILTFPVAFAFSALLSICTLALIALGSRSVRRYAARNPWRYAALCAIMTASNVMAQKPPATSPPGFYLRLLSRASTNTAVRTMRPVDFRIEVK